MGREGKRCRYVHPGEDATAERERESSPERRAEGMGREGKEKKNNSLGGRSYGEVTC